MKTKLIMTWIVILLIGIAPVFLLLAYGSKDYSIPAYTLGQMFGLMGMTFFALTFILSTRAKWIENLFGGLDKMYPVHSILGAVSFILILMHPLFLITKYIPSNIYAAAKYILPGGFLSVDLGIFALLGIILLLAITFYSNWKYDNWKFSHEFMGVFFILASAHILLVRTNVARDFIFHGYNTYAIIISIIGIGGFIYSLIRIYISGKKYKIENISYFNNCTEIELKPINTDKLISFKPGQFIFVKFKNKQVGRESHPFSIASGTQEKNILILAKNLGDFTSKMKYLKKGERVIVEGPYGRFHKNDFTQEVWIAGGIGITPFLSLAQDFNNNDTSDSDSVVKRTVDLFYSVKEKEEFVHLEKFEKISKLNKNFRVFPWVTNEDGYINVEQIAKKASLKNKEFYLCGPASLKEAIRNGLHENDISEDRIHDERFAFK